MIRNEFKQKKRTLDRVTTRHEFAQAAGVMYVTLFAQGWCNSRRRPLWTLDETLQLVGQDYGPGELWTHLALVVINDRPTSQAELDAAFHGNLWDQPELPFSGQEPF